MNEGVNMRLFGGLPTFIIKGLGVHVRTYIVSTYNIITRAEIVKTADYNIKTINVLDVRLGYGLISYECSFYGALEALYDRLR